MYKYKVESLLLCSLVLWLESSNTFVCFTAMHWLINILIHYTERTQKTDETSKHTTEAAECQNS
jgi:hypothetical protein